MKEIVTNAKLLRRPTKDVKEGEDISEIVDDLLQGLREYKAEGIIAVGLSSNQLGYDKRIFAMRMPSGPPVCIVNPMITKARGSQLSKEMCLSIPSVTVTTKRPYQVTVKGLNRYFKHVKYKVSGLQARIVCHEVDHLNGVLITDHEETKG